MKYSVVIELEDETGEPLEDLSTRQIERDIEVRLAPWIAGQGFRLLHLEAAHESLKQAFNVGFLPEKP